MALRRRSKPVPEPAVPEPVAQVDPARVPPRFREIVVDALDARRRYTDLVAAQPDGMVRERLAALTPRVDAGVLEVWANVQRVTAIEATVAALDPDGATDALKQAKRTGADPAVLAALTERFSATQRLLNAVDDIDTRLRVVDARLQATVARAAELALVVAPEALDLEVATLGSDLDGALAELAALRTGLDEVSRIARGA